MGSYHSAHIVFYLNPRRSHKRGSAATKQFKVFAPDLSGAQPICEMVSHAETAALRDIGGQLQIQIYTEQGPKWQPCVPARAPDTTAKKSPANKAKRAK